MHAGGSPDGALTDSATETQTAAGPPAARVKRCG